MEHTTLIVVAVTVAFCVLFGFLAERSSKKKHVQIDGRSSKSKTNNIH